jgi:hypothetical protein
MIDLPVAAPSHRFLVHQRDRRWPRVLSSVLLLAAVVLGVLLLVGWPRLRSTSVHYQLIQLRAQTLELERRERGLRVELECERSPLKLAARARQLGLEPPPPPVSWERVAGAGEGR